MYAIARAMESNTNNNRLIVRIQMCNDCDERRLRKGKSSRVSSEVPSASLYRRSLGLSNDSEPISWYFWMEKNP